MDHLFLWPSKICISQSHKLIILKTKGYTDVFSEEQEALGMLFPALSNVDNILCTSTNKIIFLLIRLIVLCILTSFWVLRATESWLKYVFGHFKPIFCWFQMFLGDFSKFLKTVF